MADRPGRVLPAVTRESRPFWTGGFDGELRIYRCRACRGWFHPPVGACFRCRSRDVGPEVASGRATVAAFTVNHHPWFPDFPPPYVIAMVELAEQPDVRLTTCLVECDIDQVTVGMPVEVVFDAHEDVALPLFRPVRAEGEIR
ncbi:Zn-ribbon domain-containing OB-fold protein [Actinomadura sp. SCN-SB]|uniref:Zn-ribbon domain-containing OB-fold protein n=1 Tax=Actinomadura sp. SCN-SB TaxID=3373092 RepID=UPI00374FFD3B